MPDNNLSRPRQNSGIKPERFSGCGYRITWFYLLILITTGATIYLNSLDVPFCFDDYPNIVDDPHIRLTELNWEGFSSLSHANEFERPFSVLTFALNYYFGQYDVFGYHLVNIIIHILNSLLLFFIVKKTWMLNTYPTGGAPAEKISPDVIAFFTTLIWLVHPLQTQSVTYIVQRENSLSAMFYIFALLLYINGRISLTRRQKEAETDRNFKNKSPYYYFAGCFVCGLLAMASKENAATLPFSILFYEWFFFQNLKNILTRRRWIWIAATFILFGIISMIYLGKNPLDLISPAHYRKSFTVFERFISEFRVVIYYMGLILFPHPERLTLDYDYPFSTSPVHPVTTFICLFAVVFLFIMAADTAKKNRILSFCILWYFGTQMIESSFIPLALVFEHRTYLPSMMVCFLLVTFLFRSVNHRRMLYVLLCGITFLFSFWTFQRNITWSNEVAFWEDGIKKSPNLYRPYNNLGTALLRRQMYDKAVPIFRKAIQLDPSKEKGYSNMGLALKEQGKTDQAMAMFNKSLDMNPEYNIPNIGLGNIFMEQRQPGKAIQYFKTAIENDPFNTDILNNLGNAYLELGYSDTAIGYFKRALKETPESRDILNNLGNALMAKNMFQEAASYYIKILKADPANMEANINMGVALAHLNNIDAAITHYQAALKTAPDNAEAHNNLGVLLVQNKKYEEALKHFTTALHLRPGYASAQSNIKKLQTLIEK